MKLEHTFAVPDSVDDVWDLLLDLPRVGPCMPGAEIGEKLGDTSYSTRVGIRLGPVILNYRGRLTIVTADRVSRRAVLEGKGEDDQHGTATATITTTLSSEGAGTRASMTTDLEVTGRLAHFGSGMVADMSTFLVDEFVERLKRELARGKDSPDSHPTGESGGPASLSAVRVFVEMARLRLRRIVGGSRRQRVE